MFPDAPIVPGWTTAPMTEIGLFPYSRTCSTSSALVMYFDSSGDLMCCSACVAVMPATSTLPRSGMVSFPSSPMVVLVLRFESWRTLMSTTSRAPSGASPGADALCAVATEATRRRTAANVDKRLMVPCDSDFVQIQQPLPTLREQRPLRKKLPSNPLDYWTLPEVYEAPVNPAWASASTTRKRLCALRVRGYFKFGYGLRDNLKVPRIPLSSSASGEFDLRW